MQPLGLGTSRVAYIGILWGYLGGDIGIIEKNMETIVISILGLYNIAPTYYNSFHFLFHYPYKTPMGTSLNAFVQRICLQQCSVRE